MKTEYTPTLSDFVAEIDRFIDANEPMTNLWNYCVLHRKRVLRNMVRHDMELRKILSHHELMPGRVAANTETLLQDLTACNASPRQIEKMRNALTKIRNQLEPHLEDNANGIGVKETLELMLIADSALNSTN